MIHAESCGSIFLKSARRMFAAERDPIVQYKFFGVACRLLGSSLRITREVSMKTAPVFLILVIAGLLLIPVPTSGQVSGPTDPILTSAEEAQRDGHLADAEKILSDAIQQAEESDPQNPQLPQYREQLVLVLHQEGRITQAEKMASEAVQEVERAGPDTPQVAHALQQLAWLVSDKGELSKALILYQRGLEIDQNVLGHKIERSS